MKLVTETIEQLKGVLVFLSDVICYLVEKNTDNVFKHTLLLKILPYCLQMNKRIFQVFCDI